ncbi:MAG: DUF4405 domain-containing protein [Planctomycetota bacterium]
MKRSSLNFLIDAAALAAFAVILSTGLLLRYVLPPGSGRVEGSSGGYGSSEKMVSLVWGYMRHEWGAFHFWVSVVLPVILTLHLLLHWRWIVGFVGGRRPREGSGSRFALGVLGLVALIAVSVAPLVGEREQTARGELKRTRSVAAPETESPSHSEGSATQAEHAEDETIRGLMTLREVERETGVPVSYLLSSLRMPADTSPDETLGRLRRAYGFAMSDVRRVVKEYAAPNR